jgi:hypothetical protein
MRDGELRASIDRMEAWVADPTWEPDPEALVRWNAEFQTALAQAEKGPGWQDLMARAHAAGRQLEMRTVKFAQARDQVKAELDAFERGNRALKGYRAGVR